MKPKKLSFLPLSNMVKVDNKSVKAKMNKILRFDEKSNIKTQYQDLNHTGITNFMMTILALKV